MGVRSIAAALLGCEKAETAPPPPPRPEKTLHEELRTSPEFQHRLMDEIIGREICPLPTSGRWRIDGYAEYRHPLGDRGIGTFTFEERDAFVGKVLAIDGDRVTFGNRECASANYSIAIENSPGDEDDRVLYRFCGSEIREMPFLSFGRNCSDVEMSLNELDFTFTDLRY